MKKQSGRRQFIRNLGLGGISAGILPPAVINANENFNSSIPAVSSKEKKKKSPSGRNFNGSYTGEYLDRVAFPLGGMGAGMFCVEGSGAISHMSIQNKPDVYNEPAIFAALSIKGIQNGSKILEGPVPDWKKFGRPDTGNGSGGSTTGLPRFDEAEFLPRFPFATLDLGDSELPVKVNLSFWSPFVPTEENLSSLPLAGIEYAFTNTGQKKWEGVFSFHAKNFLKVDKGKNSILPADRGFILFEKGTDEKPYASSFAVQSDQEGAVMDYCWFRGGWWDPVTMVWNTIRNSETRQVPPVEGDAPGASLYIPFQLDPGQQKTIRLRMAWYTPESELTVGKMGIRKENCDPASGCCNSPDQLNLDPYDKNFDGKYYKPWYSSQFDSIRQLMEYWEKNYEDLKQKSGLFRDAFFSSTLPPEVMEAVAANLTILKSPTVMRQFDGRLWSWEGCGDSWGCCHGSCTHVWNYAQAIAHLFPALERSLRATEFCENQSEIGHQNFRAVLPIQPASHDFHAAADGQLGGIMKVYREWRISGDNEWMKKMFPMVKKSLDYCITTWDPRHKGVIEEPHHNTYDIEFWGPDGMHSSFYIGALTALIEMGKFLKVKMDSYEKLLALAKKYMEANLYDGEYFIQKIQVEGLNAPNPAEEAAKSMVGKYSDEARKLLEAEGPKYQYGTGCLSDGVLGCWIARMCGLPDSIDTAKIKSHLKAVHKYNLKKTLKDHANPQRPSFALGDDGGLLLCTWPKGGKLSLPFVYSDEVWTGIEHQVAAHLMLTGQVAEGLEILQLSRLRYDGRVRNPFNEYECGHWYARALSSYGYIEALTGVRYDAVEKTLYVNSRVGDFTSFLSTQTGFGTVRFSGGKVTFDVVYGKLDIKNTKIS